MKLKSLNPTNSTLHHAGDVVSVNALRDASIRMIQILTIDKIAAADMILFATPVYWWGMSAQLKLVIDKCYCRGLQLKNKKVGTIVVGGSPVDSIQYELIDKQFDCMAKYLSWDMLFNKSYYATARDELEKNKNSMNELEGIGKNL